jgi:hypothetical protein
MFKCDICEREFCTSRGMNVHRKNHNPEIIERRRQSAIKARARDDVKEKHRQAALRPEVM